MNFLSCTMTIRLFIDIVCVWGILNIQNLLEASPASCIGKTNIIKDSLLIHLDRTNICPWITTGVLVERY